MSNNAVSTSPGQPPDGRHLTLVSFTAELTVPDRDELIAGLAEADAQLHLLPQGRVLRGTENSKLARRLTLAAARADLRPRLLKVMHSAVHLLVHYSRLRDEISLAQLAHAAELGTSGQRRLGADLAELAALGLLLYRPGRGRGRASVLGVPARFATDVLVRMQREGRWAPPPTAGASGVDVPEAASTGVDSAADAANATDGPAVEGVSSGQASVGVAVGDLRGDLRPVDGAAQEPANADEKPPGGGGVSDAAHLFSTSRVKPSPPSSNAPANTSTTSSHGGNRCSETHAEASVVLPVDVDWVLRQVFTEAPFLRTEPGTRERKRQASAIRKALGQEFRRWDIARRITHALPPVVDAPGGLVRYRVERMMACAESPRSRRLRTEVLRAGHDEQQQQAAARRHANDAWQQRLLEAVPVPVVAGLVGLARPRLQVAGKRVLAGPSALAAEISTMLRAVVPEVDGGVSTEVLADAALRVLIEGGGQVLPVTPAVLTAAGAARTFVALVAATSAVDAVTISSVQQPGGSEEAVIVTGADGECVSCGDNGTTVAQRADLPRASFACESCYAAAVADQLSDGVVPPDSDPGLRGRADAADWLLAVGPDFADAEYALEDEGDLTDEEVA